MMIMTAKVDFKKIILITAGAAVLILAAIFLLGGTDPDTAPAPTALQAGSNEGRVQFLKDLGWDVSAESTESGQVKIPAGSSEVFDRYNLLQKSQGYDLSTYAGKTVMRYVYKINNYPGTAAPVYATLLVHDDQVIGGDVTDTAPGGRIHSLKMSAAVPAPSHTRSTESGTAESSSQ